MLVYNTKLNQKKNISKKPHTDFDKTVNSHVSKAEDLRNAMIEMMLTDALTEQCTVYRTTLLKVTSYCRLLQLLQPSSVQQNLLRWATYSC